MQKDLDERMDSDRQAQRLLYHGHPSFLLQDRHVLAPHRLSRRTKEYISTHLLKCAYCTRLQERLRSNPDDWLAVWGSADPRSRKQ
jgi:hypothetical protein